MIPILLNTSEPMLKVKVVTIKDQAENTLKHLQKLGVLHVEQARELSPIDKTAIGHEKNRVRVALNSLESILGYITGEKTVHLPETLKAQPLDEIIDQSNRMYSNLSKLTENHDRLENTIDNLEGLGRYLGILAQEIDAPLKDLHYSGNYLFTNVLVMSNESYKTFHERTEQYVLQDHTIAGEESVVSYFVARAEDKESLETIIRELGIVTLTIPKTELKLKEFISKNDETIQKLRNDSDKLQREIQANIEDNLETIVFSREVLDAENERLSVLDHAREARYVTLIEGFAPENNVDAITSELKDVLDYAFVSTERPTRKDEPPTKLRNPGAIKPFEVIVSLFSLPKYGDWDPTPSVAYFFAFFFGLMLNDVVYAFGLLILARFLLDKLVDDPESEGTQLFRKVLYISGTVALVLGIISGTYLGDFLHMYFDIDLKTIALIKGIQNQLADPISFIILSLIIGLIHLNIAHMLGLIKGLKEKDKGMVVGKIGLFFVQIFGIPYIFKSLLNIELFSLSATTYSAFSYLLIFGLLLIVIGAFMHMGALGGIFWIFDLTGILGDVMSYSRLAGVGLATYYLASSFNLLSNWVSSLISSFIPGFIGMSIAFIVGIILLVIFHVFNLLLSSLAAFIHSLRLCFVEFLLKFYEGGGKEYAPFHLKPKREVIVGKKS